MSIRCMRFTSTTVKFCKIFHNSPLEFLKINTENMAEKMKLIELDDEEITLNQITAGGDESVNLLNLTDIENSSLNVPTEEDNDSIEELLEETKLEFSEVLDTKRKELDKIQEDLNQLMDRLNIFIADSHDDVCYEDTDSIDVQINNDDDELSEKQDGPQEKELTRQKGLYEIPIDEMYISDGLNPPEVNWDILAPFIQNVVGDLKKIRNLNQMTSSVLQRIRNMTDVTSNVTEEN